MQDTSPNSTKRKSQVTQTTLNLHFTLSIAPTMRTIAALVFTATLAASQEIGFSGGSNIAAGASAIDNPNINNGWQSDSSLFSSGGSGFGGSNTFNNIVDSHFSTSNSNSVFSDNIVNNPVQNSIKGNSGWTANGDKNNLGPVQNDFAGVPFLKRETAYSNSYHAANAYKPAAAPQPIAVPVVYHPAAYVAPVHYAASIIAPAPVHAVPAHYLAPVVVSAPEPAHYNAHSVEPARYSAPAHVEPARYAAAAAPAPAAAAEHKKAEQKTAIVQNKA
ncbi:hypothetical protein GQ54DRAFT_319338 [Martensiomyces pterosporus]|nr:hypothetical protein GQ54DRAFT_319338 [Martensiomyces pterosporus]